MRSAWWDTKETERVLGRVGRAVNAAARDFAREAAQLENGGGREAAAERLVEQQVERLLRLTNFKDRVVMSSDREVAARDFSKPLSFLCNHSLASVYSLFNLRRSQAISLNTSVDRLQAEESRAGKIMIVRPPQF